MLWFILLSETLEKKNIRNKIKNNVTYGRKLSKNVDEILFF